MIEKKREHRILVVDDDEGNLKLMSAILFSHNYSFDTAQDGALALEKIREAPPDLIFLDIMMPVMDGFETCRHIKEDPTMCHIPVVMVTALSDRESRLKGLHVGANDFIAKPIDSAELLVRMKNLLKVKEYEDFLKDFNMKLSDQVEEKTRALKQSYIDTVYRLTIAAEYKDEDTASHIKRISLYAKYLAEALGFSPSDTETIFYAAPMHDIGKIGIPDSILLKPGPLTSEEFEIIKTHATIGAHILSHSSSPIIRLAETIALHHHERWDGTGYPAGLKAEEIPIQGRILNLIDQYDALRMKRPYKPPFDHEKTFHIITQGDGRTQRTHFDPQLLQAFADNHRHFEEIFETYID